MPRPFGPAKAAGAPTVNYGVFINNNNIINFILVAFAVFLLVRQVNRFAPKPEQAGPSAKECPRCGTSIPLKASRCPHCTSDLTA